LLKNGVSGWPPAAAGVLYRRGAASGGRVASAAGLDARSRDEGDARAHRWGAATPQTALRRRNRLRWLAFCARPH